MNKNSILQIIRQRINELKFQRVSLKPFIDSDRERLRCINSSITELEQLSQQVEKLELKCIKEAN